MKGERILYPCYFNAALQRNEGRRVPRSRSIKNPVMADIVQAAKKAGLTFRVEEKHHPSCWWRREGRMVVMWDGSKESLLKKVAFRLEAKPEARK